MAHCGQRRVAMMREEPQRNFWRIVGGQGSVGRYGIIGITGVAIDFIAFAIFIWAGMAPVIATTISTLAGITNNYTWNSLLNFRLKLSGMRGAKFLTVGLIGLATSAGILQLLMTFGFDPISAKWVSTPVVAGGQFLANKFWSFK